MQVQNCFQNGISMLFSYPFSELTVTNQ